MNIVKHLLVAAVAISLSSAALTARDAEQELGASLAKPAAVADANQTLLITVGSAGKSQIAGIDFQSDGTATALQFAVLLPKGVKGVNADDCVSGLPSNFSGKCFVSNDKSNVAFVIYSAGGEALPAGMQTIGSISFDSASKAAAGQMKVGGLEVVAEKGKKLASAAKVVGVD